MSATKGNTYGAKSVPEQAVVLSSLKVGATFRFPFITFEEATGGDDSAGAHFYRVLEEKKDGLVKVISHDFTNPRKLPEETPVIEHSTHTDFFRNVNG